METNNSILLSNKNIKIYEIKSQFRLCFLFIAVSFPVNISTSEIWSKVQRCSFIMCVCVQRYFIVLCCLLEHGDFKDLRAPTKASPFHIALCTVALKRLLYRRATTMEDGRCDVSLFNCIISIDIDSLASN